MNLFQAYFTLTWFLSLALLAVMVVALIDASLRPGAAYVAASKQTKTLWVLVLAVASAASFVGGVTSLFGVAGLIAAIVYFVDVRPALRAVGGGGRGRSSSDGPYGPW